MQDKELEEKMLQDEIKLADQFGDAKAVHSLTTTSIQTEISKFLSTDAKMICGNPVQYAEGNIEDPDNVNQVEGRPDLFIRHLCMVVNTDSEGIPEADLQRFANMINASVEQGLIEYGASAPICKINLLKKDDKYRYMLFFHAASKYTTAHLRANFVNPNE